MKKGYFYIANKKKSNIKNQKGLTLVEVVIALLVISIITLVLVRGTMLSVDAIKINREKTRAQAIASEKLEVIRTINYEDIEYTDQGGNPVWGLDNPALTEDGYDISYEVTRVYVGDSSYKQIKINIFKAPMKVPLSVITQLYPIEKQDGDTIPPAAPTGLVASAAGSTSINLGWNNNSETDLAGYKIYRSTTGGFTPGIENFVEEVTVNSYSDTGLDAETIYYYKVTAVDTSGNESQPSIQAIATTLGEYTEISLPFTYNGAGEYYWKTNDFSTDPNNWSHYVNSWNLSLLEINGVDYKNIWVVQHSIPASSDGYWYIHYKATSPYAHVELR